MRIFSIVVVAAMSGLGLAGCAGSTKQTAHSLGLTSGALPAPKSFVVEGRTVQPTVYPVIGRNPPLRGDRVLSMDERKTLEASLLATPGRQPTPEEKKAKMSGARKAAPVKRRENVGFFPPN